MGSLTGEEDGGTGGLDLTESTCPGNCSVLSLMVEIRISCCNYGSMRRPHSASLIASEAAGAVDGI